MHDRLMALEFSHASLARLYNRFDGEHTEWMAPQSTSRGVSQRGIDEWGLLNSVENVGPQGRVG